MTSASMMGSPASSKSEDTEDFPLAIPPVNPNKCMVVTDENPQRKCENNNTSLTEGAGSCKMLALDFYVFLLVMIIAIVLLFAMVWHVSCSEPQFVGCALIGVCMVCRQHVTPHSSLQ